MMETKSKPTVMGIISAVLTRGVVYHGIEVLLIIVIAFSELAWGVAWTPLLWVAGGAAAIWILLTSTQDAQDEAETMLMEGEMYITDWLVGAFLMCCLSIITSKYGLQFAAIFLLAALQNLRYTALSYGWLIEEEIRVKRRNEGSDRDNLPPV